MIVVDTNVICYRWMASPHSQAADQAWANDPDWIAPLLWRSEFRNAFAGATRKRLITAEAAVDIIENAEAQFAGHEFLVSSRAVMRLALRRVAPLMIANLSRLPKSTESPFLPSIANYYVISPV